MILQGGLQQLTFGDCFNKSLDNVNLPSDLLALIFDDDSEQGRDETSLRVICSSSHLVADKVKDVFNINSLYQYPRDDVFACPSYCLDCFGCSIWGHS